MARALLRAERAVLDEESALERTGDALAAAEERHAEQLARAGATRAARAAAVRAPCPHLPPAAPAPPFGSPLSVRNAHREPPMKGLARAGGDPGGGKKIPTYILCERFRNPRISRSL